MNSVLPTQPAGRLYAHPTKRVSITELNWTKTFPLFLSAPVFPVALSLLLKQQSYFYLFIYLFLTFTLFTGEFFLTNLLKTRRGSEATDRWKLVHWETQEEQLVCLMFAAMEMFATWAMILQSYVDSSLSERFILSECYSIEFPFQCSGQVLLLFLIWYRICRTTLCTVLRGYFIDYEKMGNFDCKWWLWPKTL